MGGQNTIQHNTCILGMAPWLDWNFIGYVASTQLQYLLKR